MKPRILVIRGGAIGDFILTLPALKLVRDAFPAAHLEILGYKHIVELALHRFYADAIRSIEYAPMSGFFVPGSALAPDLVEYFASFQQVISFLYDPSGYFEGNIRRAGVKNFLAAHAPIDDSAHAAQQLARPLERLALYLESNAAVVFPCDADRSAIAKYLATGVEAVVAIHPGSGSARKNWPVEKWIALSAAVLAKFSHVRLLLIGGEADNARIDALAAVLPRDRVVVVRDVALTQLAALLERCTFFLGHDSGISHLAAAVGTPCALLFGPTDPAVWAPANPGVEVIAAPSGDLAELNVDAVAMPVFKRLAELLVRDRSR